MASVFNSKAQILKIYVPERRMKDDQPLCEWIVHRLRAWNCRRDRDSRKRRLLSE